jgi:hypothetical protein
MSILMILIDSLSVDFTSFNIGEMVLQGAHQSAKTSTNTGVLPLTSSVNFDTVFYFDLDGQLKSAISSSVDSLISLKPPATSTTSFTPLAFKIDEAITER